MIINVGKIRVGGNLLTAFAVFTMTVAAPVAIDLPASGGPVSLQAAAAQGNSGVDNSGGNAGGNGGGNAGGNGGGNAGGNGGDGDVGGNVGGAGSASNDSDGQGEILLLMPRVEIATITTSILTQRYPVFKRYPADEIVTFRNPDKAIFFFTEVLDMPGTTITHRWLYKGEVQYTTSFEVMADKSQVWSNRLLPRDKPGQWTIQLIGQDGRVLETRSVDFRPAAT